MLGSPIFGRSIPRFLSSALLPFLFLESPLLKLSIRKKGTLSVKGLLRNLDSGCCLGIRVWAGLRFRRLRFRASGFRVLGFQV